MSAEGDQAVAAAGETEEPKKETTDSAQGENQSTPAAENTPDPASSDSPQQNTEASGESSDKPQESAASEPEVTDKANTASAGDKSEDASEAATSPPPQIVVDTVPDRAQTPDEEQPKETTETKPKAEPEAEQAKSPDPAPAEKQADGEGTKDAPGENTKDAAGENTKDAAGENTKDAAEEKSASKAKDGEAGASAATESKDPPAQDGGAEAAAASTTTNKRDFNGKYRQVECENTEAFFQAVGLPWIMRKMVTKFSPTSEVKQDGDTFHIKMVTAIKAKEWNFTVGEDFEDGGLGWKKEPSKVSTSWDGDKLIMVGEPKDEKSKSKTLKQTREMDGNRMTVTFEIGNVVCKRVFEKKK